jgi:hypothetical protein
MASPVDESGALQTINKLATLQRFNCSEKYFIVEVRSIHTTSSRRPNGCYKCPADDSEQADNTRWEWRAK